MTDDDQSDAWRCFHSKMFLTEGDFDDRERDLVSVESAWAKAALGFRTSKRIGHQGEHRCRSLVAINRLLNVFKSRFEKGDTLDLLQAVAMCAEENLPLPTWLANAYCDRLSLFFKVGGCTSLDSVFRSKTLSTVTPSKAAIAREQWSLGIQIWDATWHVARSDKAVKTLTGALKKMLSQGKFDVKATTARRLFLTHEKSQCEFVGSKTLSRFLEIRRKQLNSK